MQETKLCTKCKLPRILSSFHFINKNLKTRGSVCRFCKSENNKERYKKDKQSHINKVKANNLDKQSLCLEWIEELITPCEHCNIKDYRVLRLYNHPKSVSIYRLSKGGLSYDSLESMFDTAESILCANCIEILRINNDQDS